MTKQMMLLSLAASLLLAAGLACNLSSAPQPATVDLAATAVAQTLAAPASPPLAVETSSPSEPLPVPETTTLQVAYTDASRNLWLWQEERGSIQLTRSGDVHDVLIARDGDLVAFVRTSDYRNYSIWAVGSDGSGERQVVSAADFNAMKGHADAVGAGPYTLQWPPRAGRKLVFTSQPVFDGPGSLLNDDLWQVDLDSGELKQLLPPGQGGVFYYSPDGAQIALVTPEKISLIDADGSNRRDAVLRYAPVLTYSEYRYYAAPKWSPDSSYLRVAIPPEDPLATPAGSTKVWQIASDGSPARQLTQVTTVFLSPLEFSPNLERFAYLSPSGDPADNLRNLHIVNADGSGSVIYQNGRLDFMSWSPDSLRFVYAAGEANASQLGQVGSAPISLTDVESALFVSWIDATHFIFLARTSAGWEVRLANPGATSALVARLPGNPNSFFPIYATNRR